MLGKFLIAVATVASVLMMCAGPSIAKKKPKKVLEPSHTVSKPVCSGMRTMHFDQNCHK